MTKKKTTLTDMEASDLQTEIEINSDSVCINLAGAEEIIGAPIPQTDSEVVASGALPGNGPVNSSDQNDIIQTDSQNEAQNAADMSGGDVQEMSKPKKTRKKVSNENESEENPKSTVDDRIPETVTKKKARPVRVIQEVVSIDDVRSVETDDDKAKNDLLDLTESLKAGRILTGTVQGVERTANDAIAVIYHGAYKVIIPTMEAIMPPADYHGIPDAEVHQYLLTKRLGAEFDYIVKGIDVDAKIAVASRLDAMKIKRKWHYYDIEREAGRFLYEGVTAEARVVSVIRTGIFVDLFGVEVFIPLRELSYQRMMDATYHFQTGQRVLVKVLTLDRKDRNNIQVTASVKQTTENPCEKAIRKYSVGNKYVGTVSMIDTNGVFVSLDGGIDCLCAYPKRGRPPRGARVTVIILGINKEVNRIWGAITHTALSR